MPRSIDVAYHLVDDRNWGSVQSHGLLSASRLMTASGDADARIHRDHRPRGVVLSTGAVIRGQSPMPPGPLARCLRGGLLPADWYALLNSKVFLWLDPKRLNRQRRACGESPQTVIVFDASAMLATYANRATVTPFNTGNAMRAAAARALSTFVAYGRWQSHGWSDERLSGAKLRSSSHRPIELTIADAVPDALRFATAIIPLAAGEMLTADRLNGAAPRERGLRFAAEIENAESSS